MSSRPEERMGALARWTNYARRQVRSQAVALPAVLVGLLAFALLSYHEPLGRRQWGLPVAVVAAAAAVWVSAALRTFGGLCRALTRVASAADASDVVGFLRHAARVVRLGRRLTSLLLVGWLADSLAGLLLELAPPGVPPACTAALGRLRRGEEIGELLVAAVGFRLWREVAEALWVGADEAAERP